MSVSAPVAWRPLTRAVQVLAVLLATAVVLLGLLATAQVAFGAFSASVRVQPDTDAAPDLGQDAGYSWVLLDSVRVVHPAPPFATRLLAWAGYAVIAVVVLTGCVVAFTLATRLRGGRPFSRFASCALLVLGALAVVTAFLAPALHLEAAAAAVADLGLRTSDAAGFAAYEDAGGPAALVPDRFPALGAVIRHTNWILAGVGGILIVISLAFRRGEILQRDTEGLV